MSDQLHQLLLDMIERWTAFASEMDQSESPYDKGVSIGFNAAISELEALLAQISGKQPDAAYEFVDDDDVSLEVKPETHDDEPEWEYFYINFEQAPDGIWRVKHLNGVWQPNWQISGAGLEETVAMLRQRGWKLARFASGIHVFKRPVRS